MYFGVVGVGVGLQNYASLIIAVINPSFTSIQLSLLFAPIWICDAIGILLITPLSDRYYRHRAVFFCGSCLVIIAGLLVTTLAGPHWARYSGLLIAGFGLGPTVPICMTWSAELFAPRHGEIGVASAAALVSGLGNLGSVTTVPPTTTNYHPTIITDANICRRTHFIPGGLLIQLIGRVISLRVD
jgi:MFS family permease